MVAYMLGDKPAQPLIIEPALDIGPFTAAQAALRKPDGTSAGAMTASIDGAEDQITLSWPNPAVALDVEGLWSIAVTLTNSAGASQRIATVPVIVEDPDSGWHTLPSIRKAIRELGVLGDEQAWELLWVARDAVIEFAPVLDLGQAVPVNYKKAQAMQARNVWNAGKVDAGNGETGDDTFQIRPFPLDWQIEQLLRPKSVVPVVAS